jgi:hypothetical protein
MQSILQSISATNECCTEQNVSSEKKFVSKQIRLTAIETVQKVHSLSNIQQIPVVIEPKCSALQSQKLLIKSYEVAHSYEALLRTL